MTKEIDVVGRTREELTTPALLLDLDLFERNLQRMADFTQGHGVNLRPHAKTHKCPDIARRQIDSGAIGISVATVREAEVMADAGIRGLLITSEIIGQAKVERLLRILESAPETMVVVDHPDNARELNRAADQAGITLQVLMDIDPGTRRTGIAGGPPAIELALLIHELSNLMIRGIHSYSGSSAHIETWKARCEHSLTAMKPAVETFIDLKKMGLPVEILSGGSTGTYNIDPLIDELTELQAGSYVFMDMDYRRIGGLDGEVYNDFAESLTVLSTVISKHHSDRLTVDAGIKGFATDRKFGAEVKGVSGVSFRAVGDEHGVVSLENPSREIKRGEQLEFFVPHCDPTVNLYSRIHCMRDGRVEAIWPVLGRHG